MTILDQYKAKLTEAGFNKTVSHIEQAQALTPKAQGIKVGSTTKTTADNTGGKVEVVKEADLKTTSGLDTLSLLFGVPGLLYNIGQTASIGQVDKTSTSYTGSKDDIIDLIKKTVPEPTPTPTPQSIGGFDLGGIGGILDKVIIAAVVVGGISLLKGVFK